MNADYLEWDSAFFGKRVARFRGQHLDTTQLNQLEDWCMANHIDVLYFLADANDPVTTSLAEANHFHLTDVRLTFEREIAPADSDQTPGTHIRRASLADIPLLRSISANSYTHSRFFYDQRFPVNKAKEMYAIWIEKNVRDPDTEVFVAERHDGAACGYITCQLIDRPREGHIVLVGVAEAARGAGLGQQLVATAVEWFARQAVPRVQVVTQGRNTAAQRLYQRSGFVTRSVGLWYHRWFSKG